MTDRGPKRQREAGIKQGDEGREIGVLSGMLEQLDYAEKALIESGIGESATRKVLERFKGISRKHANRLLRVVQIRWKREGESTSRPMRKNLLRQRLEQLYRLSLERKRAITVGVGIGLQEIEYVDEPDLRAAESALSKLIELDALIGEESSDEDKTPEGAREAARRAFAEAYGLTSLPGENKG